MSDNDMAPSADNRKAAITALAESLRTARARKQLTQAEVAQRAGITTAVVGEVEGEKVDPRLSTVDRLTAALGITVSFTESAA